MTNVDRAHFFSVVKRCTSFVFHLFQKDEQRKITCDEAIPRETCDGLVKKYKVMKEMYADPDLKDMLNPDAYSDLHIEMKNAGIVTGEKMYAVSYCDVLIQLL